MRKFSGPAFEYFFLLVINFMPWVDLMAIFYTISKGLGFKMPTYCSFVAYKISDPSLTFSIFISCVLDGHDWTQYRVDPSLRVGMTFGVVKSQYTKPCSQENSISNAAFWLLSIALDPLCEPITKPYHCKITYKQTLIISLQNDWFQTAVFHLF